MNTELILELRDKIENLSISVETMKKSINSLKINDQRRVDANNPIPPGIACKVAFDKNGLIIAGIGLELSDIPQLEIDKINNLKQYLDNKASTKDLEKFKVDITNMINPTIKTFNEIAGTGIKVNYNSDGRIISSSELLISDIPVLPITKIEGLIDIINDLKSKSISEDNTIEEIPSIKVSPGTYTKVNVDKYGRVTNGDKIGINDIPIEIINRLNSIESRMVNFASQNSIDIINKDLVNKITSNKSITPGTYTKVKVDSKGLITSGEKLTIRDLPELSISDINGLDKIIRNKADSLDLINLTDTVSSMVNSISKIGEIDGIKNELNDKASEIDVKNIKSKINTIQNSLDNLINKIPGDMIMEQLSQIMNEVSVLSGRISVIENYLNIKD